MIVTVWRAQSRHVCANSKRCAQASASRITGSVCCDSCCWCRCDIAACCFFFSNIFFSISAKRSACLFRYLLPHPKISGSYVSQDQHTAANLQYLANLKSSLRFRKYPSPSYIIFRMYFRLGSSKCNIFLNGVFAPFRNSYCASVINWQNVLPLPRRISLWYTKDLKKIFHQKLNILS